MSRGTPEPLYAMIVLTLIKRDRQENPLRCVSDLQLSAIPFIISKHAFLPDVLNGLQRLRFGHFEADGFEACLIRNCAGWSDQMEIVAHVRPHQGHGAAERLLGR
jgi:hypothetical protein